MVETLTMIIPPIMACIHAHAHNHIHAHTPSHTHTHTSFIHEITHTHTSHVPGIVLSTFIF